MARRPKIVGVKSGCFSLFHAGHVAALQLARAQCDYLIALTNGDAAIERKHGCVPVCLDDRMAILRALRCVDEVGFFNEPTEEEWVRDYALNRFVAEHGRRARLVMFHSPEVRGDPPCKGVVDEIRYLPLLPDGGKVSVSNMIKEIKEKGR